MQMKIQCTMGVRKEIPLLVHFAIRQMYIEFLNSKEVADYLQVFSFEDIRESVLKRRCKITMSQKEPEYEITRVIDKFRFKTPNCKVFIVRNWDEATIMLSSEY